MAVAATAITGAASAQNVNDVKSKFIHHVYFWLHNPDSAADRNKLIEGLRTLTAIDYIQMHHIGVPANTNRDVIDRSYAVSWLLIFADDAAQARYQTDPVHLEFVKNYSHLWKKVVVYDTVDA